MNKKKLGFLFLVLFCGSLMLVTNTLNSLESASETMQTDYITHNPIEILNNSAFVSYGFEGAGTSSDPYIIENYHIISTGYMSTGIFISSTTSYFIIRNCYIEADYLAIRIDQTSYGTATISNNTCVSSLNDGGGVGAGWLNGCTITNNTLIGFSQGIHLNLAYSCLIQNNIVLDSSYQGINIRYSNNNIIKDNMIKNSSQHGVALVGSSSNNDVFNNTFIDNAHEENYRIDGERTGIIHSQAYDEGPDNEWYDSENQLGNRWSDYTGDGDYVIDGSSGSVDIYPRNFPETSSTNFSLIFLVIAISLAVVYKRLK